MLRGKMIKILSTRFLSKRLGMADPPPQSFIFLDLETTGLPFREVGKTRITEVCMISVRREDLKRTDGQVPRTIQKLTILLNPQKIIPDGTVQMTGLDNFQLENELPFNEKKASVIKCFLDQCVPPLCFIAHNGMKFDFPLLQEELKNFEQIIPDGTRCADSLPAFKELSRYSSWDEKPEFSPFVTDDDLAFCDVANEIEKELSRNAGDVSRAMAVIQATNETTPKSQVIRPQCPNSGQKISKRRLFDSGEKKTPQKPSPQAKMSFKLKDVYANLFGGEMDNQHRAEDDSIALIKCCLKFGQPMLDWFDNNSIEFKEIKATYGKFR